MADYLPQANGNWSTTTWITAFSNLTAFAGGNTPPTVIDDVYADGKTITVDINTAVRTLYTTTSPRTGGLAGGGFTLSNGIILTASALAGTTTVLTFNGAAPNSCTLIGNVSGGSTGAISACVNNNSGTINIVGTVRGGTASNNAVGLRNATTGTINITGSVIGGSGPIGGAPNDTGINNISLGTINVIGSVIGGSGPAINSINNSAAGTITVSGSVVGGTNTGVGISNSSTGLVLITGSVSGGAGGTGITNSSTGVVLINGSAIGGIGGAGATNTSTGLLCATKVVGNGWGLGSVGIGAIQFGISNSQNGRAYVEQVEFGPRGATPISGPVYIIPSNRNTLTGYTTALGTPVTFYNSLSVDGLLPPVSSVQAGVVYNVGNSVGTMAVPSASAVQFGVAVDNTIGTAALRPQDVWGYARLSATQVDSMGDRLRNTATTQSIGYQIASFNL